jgi:glycerol uptake facilitator-like aquaporin
MSRHSLSRPLAAEFLGTALLLVAVVGSGIMAQRLAQGNMAVALLANALATGTALVVLITIFGPLSGAHFNPCVSLYCALRGEMTGRIAALYAVTQFIAAVCGVWLTHILFALPALQISTHLRDGPAQGLSEALATFGLLLTIVGAGRFKPDHIPVLVGLYITGAYWFTASTSFANPAVTVARMLTDSFSGIAPHSVPGFIAAQLLATLLAAKFLPWLFPANR